MYAQRTKGFTLIELLVVIAVIALLTLVGVASLNTSRQKARDAKRLADIRQVQTALQLYNSDENEYPVVTDAAVLGGATAQKLCDKASGGFVPTDKQCITTYMQEVPGDPIPGSDFTYVGDAKGFDISFTTEQSSFLGAAGTYHAHSQAISAQAGNL